MLDNVYEPPGLALFSRIAWVCVIVACFLPTLCYAGIEDRPLDSDDAYTMDKGATAVSIGALFSTVEHGDKETDMLFNFSYGITDRLEISGDIPIVFLDSKESDRAEGLGDISIRPEYMFLEEKNNRPAMSLSAQCNLRTGDTDKGLGQQKTDYEFVLNMSKNFESLTVHFNWGYTFVGEATGEDLDNSVLYGVAFEYESTEQLTIVGEVFGSTNSDPTAVEDPMQTLLGAMYEVIPNVTLDTGCWLGLTDASPELIVTGGVTYEF